MSRKIKMQMERWLLFRGNVIYLSRFLLKIRNLLFSTPNSKKNFIKDLTSRLKCVAFLISSKKPIDQEATVQHSPDQGGTL